MSRLPLEWFTSRIGKKVFSSPNHTTYPVLILDHSHAEYLYNTQFELKHRFFEQPDKAKGHKWYHQRRTSPF